MSPSDIEVLIHCHCSPTPHPRMTAPATNETIRSFLINGLIEQYNDEENIYVTTDKGRAHISQLCSTPWPVQKWADEHGRIIEA